MEEKILTREIVKENGWDKLGVITYDMLNRYTSIGYCAFIYCDKLTSITIPNSVTSIENRAFENCSNLTSVIIPNRVTSIGNRAFENCSSLASIVIPNSVTSIGGWAFCKCRSLTSITIPNSVVSIGSYAFYGCSGLTSATISNSVTSIEYGTFYNCQKLKTITIPNNVISIGGSAFSNCSGLTSVTIGNSVTSIEDNTFYSCGFKVEKRYDEQGRLIAYKGFNANMSCRCFKYEEGETYEIDGEIELCKRGFHACLNPVDCFNYYHGEIGKNVVFHEVYLEDVSDETGGDSKVVAKKITIGREITLSEMADIANRKEDLK